MCERVRAVSPSDFDQVLFNGVEIDGRLEVFDARLSDGGKVDVVFVGDIIWHAQLALESERAMKSERACERARVVRRTQRGSVVDAVRAEPERVDLEFAVQDVDRAVHGFQWHEPVLSDVLVFVPFRLEREIRQRCAGLCTSTKR